MGLNKNLESFSGSVLRVLLCNCWAVLMQGLIYNWTADPESFVRGGPALITFLFCFYLSC